MKFDNGLRVVYHADTSRSKAGFSICVNAGAINEGMSRYNLSKLGVAHFTEHLLFKSNEFKHYEDLYKSLAWEGTDYTAETGLWYTNYYGSTKSPLEGVLQTFFEAYNNHIYDEQEFEDEKNVVLNEILLDKNDIHNYMVNSLLIPALFNGTHLNRTILGSKSTLNRVCIDDVNSFKKKFYVPENTVIGLSGNFDMRSLKPFLENTFGSLHKGKRKERRFKLSSKPNYGTIQKSIPGIAGSNYLMVGFPAPREVEKSAVLADFLNDILSLDYSSRINLELRERRGVGYKVGSVYDNDYGFMYLYVDAFEPEQLESAREGINKVIDDILKNGIPSEELNGVKKLLITHYLPGESDLEDVAKSLAEQEALKLPYNIFDTEKKLKRVTPYQLNRFAKNLLRQDKVEVIVKVGQ